MSSFLGANSFAEISDDLLRKVSLKRNVARVGINLLQYPTGIDSTEGFPRAVFTIYDDLNGQRLESTATESKTTVAPEGLSRQTIKNNSDSITSSSTNGTKIVEESPTAPANNNAVISPAVMMAQMGGIDGKDNPISNGIAAKISDTANFFQEKTGAVLTSIGNTASDISKNVSDSFDSVKNKLGTGINDLKNSSAFQSVSASLGSFAGSVDGLLGSAGSLVQTAGIAAGLASSLGILKNQKLTNSLGKAGVAITLGSVATSFLSSVTQKLGDKKVANVNSEVKKTASDTNVDISKQETLNKPTAIKPVQKAITAGIVLPMPEQLRFANSAVFGEEEFPLLGALTGSVSSNDLVAGAALVAATAAGAAAATATRGAKGSFGKAIQNITGGTGVSGGRAAADGLKALGRFNGVAINPRKTVTFQGIKFRSFQFVYNFFPKNREEALRVEQIIKTFRYYSAPSSDAQTADTFIFRAPAEFEVKFYIGSEENTRIPKIKRFVIEDLIADYAPNGRYVSFEDGFPPEITLSFIAKEKELVTRESIGTGFSSTDTTGY